MTPSEAAKAVFAATPMKCRAARLRVFDELFAEDFVDHSTQPGTTADKGGVRTLYTYLREAFPRRGMRQVPLSDSRQD